MRRARVEAALAAISAVLTLASLVWPTWIESVSGLEPDAGSGEAEWWIAALFALATLVFLLLARRDRRAARRRHGLTTDTA